MGKVKVASKVMRALMDSLGMQTEEAMKHASDPALIKAMRGVKDPEKTREVVEKWHKGLVKENPPISLEEELLQEGMDPANAKFLAKDPFAFEQFVKVTDKNPEADWDKITTNIRSLREGYGTPVAASTDMDIDASLDGLPFRNPAAKKSFGEMSTMPAGDTSASRKFIEEQRAQPGFEGGQARKPRKVEMPDELDDKVLNRFTADAEAGAPVSTPKSRRTSKGKLSTIQKKYMDETGKPARSINKAVAEVAGEIPEGKIINREAVSKAMAEMDTAATQKLLPPARAGNLRDAVDGNIPKQIKDLPLPTRRALDEVNTMMAPVALKANIAPSELGRINADLVGLPIRRRYQVINAIKSGDLKSAENMLTDMQVAAREAGSESGQASTSSLLQLLGRNKKKLAALGVGAAGLGATYLMNRPAEEEEPAPEPAPLPTPAEDPAPNPVQPDAGDPVDPGVKTFNIQPGIDIGKRLEGITKNPANVDYLKEAITDYQKKAEFLQNFMKELSTEQRQEAKELRNSSQWREVAAQLANALTKIGAGMVGLRKGAFPSNLELAKTDFGSQLTSDLQTLNETYGDLQKELTSQYKSVLDKTEGATKEIGEKEKAADKDLERRWDQAFKEAQFEQKQIDTANRRTETAERDRLRAERAKELAQIRAENKALRDAEKKSEKLTPEQQDKLKSIPSVQTIVSELGRAEGDDDKQEVVRSKLIVAGINEDKVQEIIDSYYGNDRWFFQAGDDVEENKANAVTVLENELLNRRRAVRSGTESAPASTEFTPLQEEAINKVMQTNKVGRAEAVKAMREGGLL